VKEEKEAVECSPGSTCAGDPMASVSSLASRPAEASSLECSPSIASSEKAEGPAPQTDSPSVVSTTPSFDGCNNHWPVDVTHGAGSRDGPCTVAENGVNSIDDVTASAAAAETVVACNDEGQPLPWQQQPQQQEPELSSKGANRLSVDALLEEARARLLEDSVAETSDEGDNLGAETVVADDEATTEKQLRHDDHSDPDTTILATLVGKWQITTPRATTVCTVRGDGSTLFNGRHMGDEYDLVEEVVAGEVVVRRCDGWILDLLASKKGLLVWRKEGQSEIRWVRMNTCSGGQRRRDDRHDPSDGRTVTVSILFPRRGAQLKVPAVEQPPPSSRVQRILANCTGSGHTTGDRARSGGVSDTSGSLLQTTAVMPTGLFSCGSCRCVTAEGAAAVVAQ